jgi:DNA-binding transcriptional ArsR family regulator
MAKTVAPIFAALGDPTRLALFTRLADGRGRSIATLSADTAMTRQAVTRHLRVLEAAGLVASLRLGRETRFTFRPEPIAGIRGYLDDVTRQWDDAPGGWKAPVEG